MNKDFKRKHLLIFCLFPSTFWNILILIVISFDFPKEKKWKESDGKIKFRSSKGLAVIVIFQVNKQPLDTKIFLTTLSINKSVSKNIKARKESV